MVFVSFVVILGVIFAYLDDKKVIKHGFYISFWLIAIVFSLRYGYANDYFSYEKMFNNIAKYSSLHELFNNSSKEIGWALFCYFFSPFGFKFFIAVHTFFLLFIYYYVIDKYIPKPYRWVGVLIALMYPNLFLLNLSMLRQGLAGALLLLAFFKGYENRKIQSIVLCLLAVSIHQMSIAFVPFILMIILKKYVNPLYVLLVLISVFLYFYLNPDKVEMLFAQAISSDFVQDSYSNYLANVSEGGYGLAIFTRLVVVLPSIIWFKKLSEMDKYITLMFSFAPFTLLFSSQNFLLLRMECFFLPFSALLVSRSLCKVQEDKSSKGAKLMRSSMVIASVAWVLFTVRSFFYFFSEPTYAKYYAHFNTIFSNI